ncbi:MAG: exodeoxyribonuclease VII small subunit [Lachnospiraceae bacterium]
MEKEEQVKTPTIEELFAKLDGIITELQEPDVSLEETFSLYETGMKTLQVCNEKVDRVEKKIQMLNEQGERISE